MNDVEHSANVDFGCVYSGMIWITLKLGRSKAFVRVDITCRDKREALWQVIKDIG